MTKNLVNTPKTGKKTRGPWHLQGREEEIKSLREKGLTFEEIGRVIGCTGEGARLALARLKKPQAVNTSTEATIATPGDGCNDGNSIIAASHDTAENK